MESAIGAADHIWKAREYMGEPGSFPRLDKDNYTTAIRPSAGESIVYRRYRAKGAGYHGGMK